MISKIKYKRVLLKISGEALLGKKPYGLDPQIVNFFEKVAKTFLKSSPNCC